MLLFSLTDCHKNHHVMFWNPFKQRFQWNYLVLVFNNDRMKLKYWIKMYINSSYWIYYYLDISPDYHETFGYNNDPPPLPHSLPSYWINKLITKWCPCYVSNLHWRQFFPCHNFYKTSKWMRGKITSLI